MYTTREICDFCFTELRFRAIYLCSESSSPAKAPTYKQDMAASTVPSKGELLCLQSYFDLINVNRNTGNDFKRKQLSLLECRGL